MKKHWFFRLTLERPRGGGGQMDPIGFWSFQAIKMKLSVSVV